MNLGPGWAWMMIFVMALVGIGASLLGAVLGIVWLFRHVTIS